MEITAEQIEEYISLQDHNTQVKMFLEWRRHGQLLFELNENKEVIWKQRQVNEV